MEHFNRWYHSPEYREVMPLRLQGLPRGECSYRELKRSFTCHNR
ncbi:hypothetical protein [Dictyobacter arantiisoli]